MKRAYLDRERLIEYCLLSPRINTCLSQHSRPAKPINVEIGVRWKSTPVNISYCHDALCCLEYRKRTDLLSLPEIGC